jgi:iron complex transport system substrate-binding protein
VQNKRVYLIDSDLIDRPSPRLIDGLEIMARCIHPEAFD